MKYAIKTIRAQYIRLNSLIAKENYGSKEFTELRIKQNELLRAISILNETTVNEANRGFCECDDNPHRILMTLSKCAECGKIVED